ncbi:MAG: hypothetical protein KDJ55_14845 [Rhodobiaceae bacterium]|nr:hypothetical protein [Rhodobiaceae bacterium]MCC0013337.1 hypothetical protein [Rhodobiaceae bacterium]
MSRLQDLLIEAKGDLPPWQSIPEELWGWIASQCGAAELAEIQDRILRLEAELETTEVWDGDTCDDIHKAIHMFRAIAEMAQRGGK